MARPAGRVEKVMSLGLADFHRSLRTLVPDIALAEDQKSVSISADGTAVTITFEAQDSATLGGLLVMPRARVTLTFEGMDASAQAAFLSRFDQAFQRGGG